MSTTSLPPWDRTPFTFGWNGNETGPYTLPQCSNTTWNYWEKGNNRDPNPPPSPPYQLVIYAGGYVPYMVSLNNTVATGNTTWIANLPVLDQPLLMTPEAGCNAANPLKPSTLDVEVTGSGQCQQAFINVKNGTAPYRMEVVPMNTQQKTLHYASSPFGVTLDMGAGVEYFLAVYDSAGNSAVMGSYNILASPDNSCLGEAATVTAGQYSTLYPGGTSSATAASASSNGLATSTVIGIAVTVPVAAIILTALLLWFCYKQNRRQRELEEKPEIDTVYTYPPIGYTPVPATATYHTGPNVSSTGSYNTPAPIPYPTPFTSSDSNTTYTDGDASTSEPSSTSSSKRRHLINPDAHSLGPIAAEPFDPSSISGTSGLRPNLPPLPPAYSGTT